MPPNRKNTGLFTSNAEYESLKIPIQSKYLPLTDLRSEVVTATSTAPAKVQQQQQQHHHQTKLEDDVVSIHQPVAVVVEEEEDLTYSYWDIPSDIPVEDEKEEIINDLFSLAHIESNMITDSIVIKKLEEESATTTTMKQQQEPESYWTWSNDTDNDWNDTYYDNTIESKSVSVSSPDKDCEDCCQDYWAWESSSAVVDIDESDNNDYGVEEDDDVVMMKAATTTKSMSTNNNNVDVDRRKQPAIRNVLTKSWRKHKHLPEPEQPATACSTTTASTSEHYWHWQEFHSKSCSSQ